MTKEIYKLHVVERGEGRPVILLHGAFSTHRYWNFVTALLEKKRRLLLPDLLGYGSSPKPRRADYSLEQFVACLEHTFDEYNFGERPVLVGHSMGALFALRWAVEQPERFSGLVLSAPMLYERSLFHQQVASLILDGKWISSKLLARIVTSVAGLVGFVPTPLARLVHKLPRHVAEDVTKQRLYVFRRLSKNTARNTYYSGQAIQDLQKLTMPVRIIVGERDHMTSHVIGELKKLQKTNPRCEVIVVPGAHQIPLEYPEKIAKAVTSL